MNFTRSSQNISIQLAKALLVVLFTAFLYKRLFLDQSILSLYSELHWSELRHHLQYISLAIVLVAINWSLETYRWRAILNARVQRNVSWSQSLSAVLSGVTLGIISPARLGEYAGRLFGLRPEERSASLIATLLCSLALMIVTVGFGIVGYLSLQSVIHLNIEKRTFIGIVLGFVLLGMILILLLPKVIKLISNEKNVLRGIFTPKPGQEALPKASANLDTTANSLTLDLRLHEVPQLLLISICRYLVYAFQYVLVLWFFGVETPLILLFYYVWLIFLIQTVVPLPALMSLVARGGIAVMVLSFLGINELVILISALTIWIMNLVLPAIIGLIIILRAKKHGYKKV